MSWNVWDTGKTTRQAFLSYRQQGPTDITDPRASLAMLGTEGGLGASRCRLRSPMSTGGVVSICFVHAEPRSRLGLHYLPSQFKVGSMALVKAVGSPT